MMTMLKKRNSMLIAVVLLLFTLALAVQAVPFDASSVLFKVSLTKNDVARRELSVSSSSAGEFTFRTSVAGVTVDPPQLSADAGMKTVDVVFDSSGTDPGVYVGALTLQSDDDALDIPIIFEVESQDVFFDGTITLPAGDVPLGGKLTGQVKVFDLVSAGDTELGPSVIDIDYFVYAHDGSVVHTESERLSVERQTQISKTIGFPEYVEEGMYVFAAVVRYKSSIGTASAPFRISSEVSAASSASRFDRQFFFVLTAVLAFFVILIVLFIYIIHDRDKFILDLRNFHFSEMESHHNVLAAQAEIIHHRTRAHRTELAKQVRDKIQLLKQKHQKQAEEMQRLRDAGEMKKMQQKLAEWKKAGFNTMGLEYRLKGISAKDMAGIMARLKKSYGVTGVPAGKNAGK